LGEQLRIRRPRTVNIAVGVIALGTMIGLVDRIRQLSVVGAPFGTILTVVNVTLVPVIVTSLLILIASGRNWARMTLVVLALLSIPAALIGIALPGYGVARFTEALRTSMTLLGTILLLLPESNAWFARMRAPGG
jgi:hypothetical protein